MTRFQLKALRKSLGLTQTEFCQALGYRNYCTVSDWERGVRKIPKRAIELIWAKYETKKKGME